MLNSFNVNQQYNMLNSFMRVCRGVCSLYLRFLYLVCDRKRKLLLSSSERIPIPRRRIVVYDRQLFMVSPRILEFSLVKPIFLCFRLHQRDFQDSWVNPEIVLTAKWSQLMFIHIIITHTHHLIHLYYYLSSRSFTFDPQLGLSQVSES